MLPAARMIEHNLLIVFFFFADSKRKSLTLQDRSPWETPLVMSNAMHAMAKKGYGWRPSTCVLG